MASALTYYAAVHPVTGAAVTRGSTRDGYKYAAVSPSGREASFSADHGNACYYAASRGNDWGVVPVEIVSAAAFRAIKATRRMPAAQAEEKLEELEAFAGAVATEIVQAAPTADRSLEMYEDMPPATDPVWSDAPLSRLAAGELETPIATPTGETYAALQCAFDHFNAALFGGSLPRCLLTLQRKEARVHGYFWGERFVSADGAKLDEIAMNPSHFGLPIEWTLSVIAHELAHSWQHHHGARKSRAGYHNAEWAAKMREIGLIPSATGAAGGKETGQKMSHYIEPGGAFARAAATLLEDASFRLRWREVADSAKPGEKKAATRTKFVCATCDAAAWAKPTARLICGDCQELMLPAGGAADGEE